MDSQTFSQPNSNQININLGHNSMDSSGISGYKGGSNSSMQSYQTGASSNLLEDATGNQSMKFWQSNINNQFLATPSFMGSSTLGGGLPQTQPKNMNSSNVPNIQQPLLRNNSEPAANALNAKYTFANNSTKGSGMNINSPSYFPSYTTSRSYSSSQNNSQRYDAEISPLANQALPNRSTYSYDYNYSNNASAPTSELYDRSNLTNFALNNYGKSEDETLHEEVKRNKVELIVKNQVIKNLTDQLNTLNKAKSKALVDSTSSMSLSKNIKLPNNYIQLFKDLTKTLQDRTLELEDTKERLEAILVSLTIKEASSSSFTNTGSYDEQELTHKIINKLSLLQSENENLLKMVSFSNKSSLVIELGLLRNENKNLKDKLSKFEEHVQ